MDDESRIEIVPHVAAGAVVAAVMERQRQERHAAGVAYGQHRMRQMQRDRQESPAERDRRQREEEREKELRERIEVRRRELKARERELVASAENIDHTTDPAWLAKQIGELDGVRRILAVLPEYEVEEPEQPKPDEHVALLVETLRDRHKRAVGKAVYIRLHDVGTVDRKLGLPFDTSTYTPPRTNSSMPTHEVEAVVSRGYESAKAKYFAALEAQKVSLLARADELDAEAERIVEELRGLGAGV